MLPSQPMSPPSQPQGPVGPGPGNDPDAIKGQVIQLLREAKKVAEQNGVDWSELLSEVEGNKVRSDTPLPRPPKPSY